MDESRGVPRLIPKINWPYSNPILAAYEEDGSLVHPTDKKPIVMAITREFNCGCLPTHSNWMQGSVGPVEQHNLRCGNSYHVGKTTRTIPDQDRGIGAGGSTL